MDFHEARLIIDVLTPHSCGERMEKTDGTSEPIEGHFDFEHDQCWVSLYRREAPELKPEEVKRLEDAGWFFDEEHDCWSHF